MLETDRLLLRPPMAEDLPAWSSFLSDPGTTKFIGGPQDATGAWRNLCLFAGAWQIQGFSNFSILEKETGRWIGRVGAWMPPNWPGREIGWALSRTFWGKGYACEAAARCLEWAFVDLDWTEAVHVIHKENVASIAVAKRLGAQRQFSLSSDTDVYVTTRDVWRKRSKRAR